MENEKCSDCGKEQEKQKMRKMNFCRKIDGKEINVTEYTCEQCYFLHFSSDGLKQIINTKLSLNDLKKNEGIHEFYEADNFSIGVSFEEDDDGNECYIYNLFDEFGNYINIGEKGNHEQPINDLVINELIENIKELIENRQ